LELFLLACAVCLHVQADADSAWFMAWLALCGLGRLLLRHLAELGWWTAFHVARW